MAFPQGNSSPSVDLCLFDLDFTLIKLTVDAVDSHVEHLKRSGHIFPRHCIAAAYEDGWEDYLHNGFRHSDQAKAYLNVVQYALARLGVCDPGGNIAADIDNDINDVNEMTIYEDSVTVLQSIRSAGIEIGLATGRWHDPGPDLDHVGLTSYFDRIYFAGTFGHQKDSCEFWASLVLDTGRSADEILLIDDSLMSVEAARKTGLQALAIHREGSPLPIFDSPDLSSLTEVLPLLQIRLE